MNKKLSRYFLFVFVFLISYFYLLENEKSNRIEKNISSFQLEYKDFITKSDNSKDTLLDKITSSGLLKSSGLNNQYQKIKNDTFKNFRDDYLKEVYKYNFFKSQNTAFFSETNKSSYTTYVSESDALLTSLEKDYSIKDLNQFKANINALKKISSYELSNSKLALYEYNSALKNKDTTLSSINDCDDEQTNTAWVYESLISNRYCNKIGLSNCLKLNSNNTNAFDTKTLNNPSKVKDNIDYHEYVSFDENDFRVLDFKNMLEQEKKYSVFVEVFSKQVINREIYKYNIIVIDKTTTLNCTNNK